MSSPIVPQRPTRSQNPPTTSISTSDGPQIPPRPTRHLENPVSPSREAFARSPLNESPFASKIPPTYATSYNGSHVYDGAELERAPSISQMPTVGQEGMEYATYDQQSTQQGEHVIDHSAPNETRNVAGDLPLHAPTAQSATAQSKIEPITRTDSTAAAGAGIGKPVTEYEEHERSPRPPSAKSASYRPPSSLSHEQHLYESEHTHGIPEIGVHVPLLVNAGDVQAPASSAPLSAGPDSQRRKKSAQGFLGPPGSYGLHGHGMGPIDHFDKAWYQKHPEQVAKEGYGAYGPSLTTPRGEWAMSEDELNRLVRETRGRDLNHDATAPSEDIGYMVSEEYNSKKNSPAMQPVKTGSGSETHALSPLRQAVSFGDGNDTSAIDEELEGDAINLDSRSRRSSRLGHVDHGHEPLSRQISNIDDAAYRRSDTPILASDETAKNPQGEYLRAAVTSEYQSYDDQNQWYEHDQSGRQSRESSRPNSRPNSTYGGLSRFTTADDTNYHHLEEIEEYEPLFNDEGQQVRPKTMADRIRPLYRFPSKDIWEDSPSSVYLETTVVNPEQLEETEAPESSMSSARAQNIAKQEQVDTVGDLTKVPTKTKYDVHGRPILKQRFPSRDIWEDTPDSAKLETIIAPSDEPEARSPPEATSQSATAIPQRPQVPPRPARAKPSEQTQIKPQDPSPPQRFQPISPPGGEASSESRDLGTSPTERKPPNIPDRPKPQVPPRPPRSSQTVKTGAALERTTSAGSEGATSDKDLSSPTGKTKPPIPARPHATSNDKLASFKADLASRLQQGPKPPPKPEPARDIPAEEDEDKAQPLGDARKGRARGPARRKPAPQSSTTETTTAGPIPTFTISLPETTWSIDNAGNDSVQLSSKPEAPQKPEVPRKTTEPAAVPIATNTAGEPLLPTAEASGFADAAELAHAPDAEGDRRAKAEELLAQKEVAAHTEARVGAEGDVPEEERAPVEEEVEGGKGVVVSAAEGETMTTSTTTTTTSTTTMTEEETEAQT